MQLKIDRWEREVAVVSANSFGWLRLVSCVPYNPLTPLVFDWWESFLFYYVPQTRTIHSPSQDPSLHS